MTHMQAYQNPYPMPRLRPGAQKLLMNRKKDNCLFCVDPSNKKKLSVDLLMKKALFTKYSSSQNYYYTKDINDIMADLRTPAVIKYKDYLVLDEEDEFLKRYYKLHEYDYKIGLLVEYYKFHKDIARMFMVPGTDTLNRYHDKKRKLNYIKITSKLKAKEEQKKNGGEIITIKDVVINNVQSKIKNKILVKLDFFKKYQQQIFKELKLARKKQSSSSKGRKKLFSEQRHHPQKNIKKFMTRRDKLRTSLINEIPNNNNSETIEILNKNLKEIVHNESQQASNILDASNYFDFDDECSLDEKNFRHFLDSEDKKTQIIRHKNNKVKWIHSTKGENQIDLNLNNKKTVRQDNDYPYKISHVGVESKDDGSQQKTVGTTQAATLNSVTKSPRKANRTNSLQTHFKEKIDLFKDQKIIFTKKKIQPQKSTQEKPNTYRRKSKFSFTRPEPKNPVQTIKNLVLHSARGPKASTNWGLKQKPKLMLKNDIRNILKPKLKLKTARKMSSDRIYLKQKMKTQKILHHTARNPVERKKTGGSSGKKRGNVSRGDKMKLQVGKMKTKQMSSTKNILKLNQVDINHRRRISANNTPVMENQLSPRVKLQKFQKKFDIVKNNNSKLQWLLSNDQLSQKYRKSGILHKNQQKSQKQKNFTAVYQCIEKQKTVGDKPKQKSKVKNFSYNPPEEHKFQTIRQSQKRVIMENTKRELFKLQKKVGKKAQNRKNNIISFKKQRTHRRKIVRKY